MAEEITTAGTTATAPQTTAPTATTPPPAAPAGWIGGYPPGALVRESLFPAKAAPAVAPAPEPEVAKPAPVEVKPDPVNAELAEEIRKLRENRLAREQAAAQDKTWEQKYNELKSQAEGQMSFDDDPVAYARAKGWDKEKQLLFGQMLLYDLAPDKAPGDLRIRLFESKQAQKEREAEEKRKAEETQRAEQEKASTYQNFVASVDNAAAAFEPGSFPESEAWFINPESGEMDHDTYVRSLVATAVNMANAAQREQRVADLSPASIAKTLEAEVARRMAKRDEKRGKVVKAAPQTEQPVVQQEVPGSAPRITGPSGMQPTESTRGTYGSGGPTPKAISDGERVSRAAAAAFRTPGSR